MPTEIGILSRAYFHCAIDEFVNTTSEEVLGHLASAHSFALEPMQRSAWQVSIKQLQEIFRTTDIGYILFEYSIPRVGKRADVVVLWKGMVVVLEYKVGADHFGGADLDQTIDYALDLKDFHSGSAELPIVPVLVATNAPDTEWLLEWQPDGVAEVIRTNGRNLRVLLDAISEAGTGAASHDILHSKRCYCNAVKTRGISEPPP